jgi:hypothetical protein
MSPQERDDEPAEPDPDHADVDLADAVEDAMEPEMRRALAPLPERTRRERGRPPREREDEIRDDLRGRGDE